MQQAFEFRGGGDLVGDHDYLKAGGMGGFDAVGGILDGKAALRRGAEHLAGEKVYFRVGLAVLDHIARDDGVKIREQASVIKMTQGNLTS